MGLFKSFKKALAPIGGAVGFAIGGPMGAAIGSGIGSLAGGGDVEDALKAAAIGGISGYAAKGIGFGQGTGTGIGSLVPSYKGTAMLGFGAPSPAALAKEQAMQSMMAGEGVSAPAKKGIFSMFDDMSMGTKLGLGAAGLGLLGGLDQEEEGEARPIDYGPDGKAFGKVVGRSGTAYDVNDPRQMESYRQELRELQQPGYDYRTDKYAPVARSSGYAHGGDVHAGGGEVDGPGTGTSDSVPARLSDGEFVLTAKAVKGAGGGDRDIGAARLYDMMSELEATA